MSSSSSSPRREARDKECSAAGCHAVVPGAMRTFDELGAVHHYPFCADHGAEMACLDAVRGRPTEVRGDHDAAALAHRAMNITEEYARRLEIIDGLKPALADIYRRTHASRFRLLAASLRRCATLLENKSAPVSSSPVAHSSRKRSRSASVSHSPPPMQRVDDERAGGWDEVQMFADRYRPRRRLASSLD